MSEFHGRSRASLPCFGGGGGFGQRVCGACFGARRIGGWLPPRAGRGGASRSAASSASLSSFVCSSMRLRRAPINTSSCCAREVSAERRARSARFAENAATLRSRATPRGGSWSCSSCQPGSFYERWWRLAPRFRARGRSRCRRWLPRRGREDSVRALARIGSGLHGAQAVHGSRLARRSPRRHLCEPTALASARARRRAFAGGLEVDRVGTAYERIVVVG